MQILISGSICYDHIMDFPDSFANHILPDQIHILSVSFVVDTLKKNFGGTAANIAYTINLLGGKGVPVGTVGTDAKSFMEHFRTHNISTEYVKEVSDTSTATAHITTDKDDNQITAFFVGALAHAEKVSLKNITEPVSLVILSPNKKEATMQYAQTCKIKKMPYVFDPGQQITTFSKDEIIPLVESADYVIANDYEMKLIQNKTNMSTADMLAHNKAIIITFGAKGSAIVTKEKTYAIDPCPSTSVQDPTGAGDAYRGGFFTGISQGFDYQTCGQIGSVAATYAVEHYGTQNHRYSPKEFSERYRNTFDTPCPIKSATFEVGEKK